MIIRFSDQATEDVYHGIHSRKALSIPKDIWSVARRKLDLLNAAHELKDFQAPPSNRLEALRGDLKGFYSIRINDKYRVIFKWEEGNAHDVKILDYH